MSRSRTPSGAQPRPSSNAGLPRVQAASASAGVPGASASGALQQAFASSPGAQGHRAASKDAHVELIVPSDTTYLSKVRQAVLGVLSNGLFDAKKAGLIALAIDEAVANIMEHAYTSAREGDRKDIEIVLKSSATRFEVLIRDRGAAFDPRVVPDVNVKEHVKQGRKGGLGIFLMRKIMDEINYSFKQGVHNELQMIKYAAPPDGNSRG